MTALTVALGCLFAYLVLAPPPACPDQRDHSIEVGPNHLATGARAISPHAPSSQPLEPKQLRAVEPEPK